MPELNPLPDDIGAIAQGSDWLLGIPSVYTGEMESGAYKFLDEDGLFLVHPNHLVEEI